MTDPITAGGTVLITGTASGIDLAIAVATPPLGEHRRHPDRRHGSERGGRQPGSPSTFAPSTFDSANSPAGKALPRSPRRRPAHPPEASAVRTLRRPSSGRHRHVGKDHGYVFGVLADAPSAQTPKPIKAWGRAPHEAVVIEPNRRTVYLTEDANRPTGLAYRWSAPSAATSCVRTSLTTSATHSGRQPHPGYRYLLPDRPSGHVGRRDHRSRSFGWRHRRAGSPGTPSTDGRPPLRSPRWSPRAGIWGRVDQSRGTGVFRIAGGPARRVGSQSSDLVRRTAGPTHRRS